MNKSIAVVLMALMTGCYSVPGYQAQRENVSLVKGGKTPIHVVQEESVLDDRKSIACRAAGAVTLPGKQSFSSYIASALKEELRSAELLSEDAVTTLHVKAKRVDFSSGMGAANWFIDVEYTLDVNRYRFSRHF